jgi:serine/threonine-protein kinase
MGRRSGVVGVGDVVEGRYELRREIGQGQDSNVFEAVHLVTGRRVALKVVRPDVKLEARGELNARLRREARALAAVRHPGVVDVLDGGSLPNGAPFMVMELLEGRTLEALIAARFRLPLDECVALALAVADALGAAHAAGIAHRALQPSSVLVTLDHARREVVKIIDFGMARAPSEETERLSGIGALIAGPAYMSPEQLLALDDVDARADIYSLGVIMFECLTGRLPYEGTYPQVVLSVCSVGPVPNVTRYDQSLPAALAGVVWRAMAKGRVDRFPTMRDLAAALRSAVAGARDRTQLLGADGGGGAPAPPKVEQRRKRERAAYSTPVHMVMGDVSIDGRSEDISAGGLLVLCRDECPTGRSVTLRFALPIEGRVARVDGCVRWSRAAHGATDPRSSRVVGIEFIGAPADVVASIQLYVSLMAGRDGATSAP